MRRLRMAWRVGPGHAAEPEELGLARCAHGQDASLRGRVDALGRLRITVYDSCIPYGEPLVVFVPGRAELYGLEGVLLEAVDITNERITELDRETPPIVLHGDLHQWNVKIRRGVLSPFDFEDLLYGSPVMDVATTLYYVRHDDDYRELAAAFRSGYERQRPWVEHEPGEVDRLMFARSIDLLNAVLLDESLELGGDMQAFIKRRVKYWLKLALRGSREPVVL